jgi:hypothetical protein
MIRGLVIASVIWAPLCALAADAPPPAPPPPTITILEGDALIYRGAGRVQAAEGVRLAPGDILETGAAAFVQVELPDHSVLQFGPTTRALLNNTSVRQKSDRSLYLMNGWCKILWPTPTTPPAAPAFDLRSRLFDIPSSPGAAVVRVAPADVTVFDERGEFRIGEHQANGASTTVSMRAGDYYRRSASGSGELNPGGASTSLAGMPRPFRDSLPSRIDRYRDNDVRPKDAPDFNYADVEAWLNAEPGIRRPFVQRWRVKARDPAFRSALIANLAAHPEWDPVLFPEKYIKKDVRKDQRPAPRPAAPPASASSPP